MSIFTGELLWLLVPLGFIMAGLLTAGYRLLSGRHQREPDADQVDPSIRVRVTGKIS
ncbi:MAG: hypothetical protein WD071_01065 [Pseudohongiella sp.]|uniref:hypothetical protein n=1 Tax=Pseudohongiella sp. TaxID=1979412 RepID=UPI0034A088BC